MFLRGIDVLYVILLWGIVYVTLRQKYTKL